MNVLELRADYLRWVVSEHSLTLDACADDSGASTNFREFTDDSPVAFSAKTRNVARTTFVSLEFEAIEIRS